MHVPSTEYQNGLAALRAVLVDGADVRAAVAFVTRGGVARLEEALAGLSDVTLEITARALDVTEPEALLDLRERLGAEVSVVIGKHARAFHPKLWLVESGGKLAVLSGSGNLTGSGMTTNDEQFEVVMLDAASDAAAAHVDRLEALTRHALPLDQVRSGAIWREWLAVRKKQAQLHRELARAERLLNERDPMPDRSADKVKLIEDLQRIYDEAVAADLPRTDGARYYPTRLLVAINRARAGDRDPVKLVSDTIRRRTQGLGILVHAGLFELTLEWLVLDAAKPYHDLFSDQSLELAKARLAEFKSGAAQGAGRLELKPRSDESTHAEPMTAAEIIAWFERRLEHSTPDGYLLPIIHRAQATLLKRDGGYLVVRRNSGSTARIPVGLLAQRVRDIVDSGSLKQYQLRDGTEQTNALIGPLLADLPCVRFDQTDQQFQYRRDDTDANT
jgi:HKD family nuclease